MKLCKKCGSDKVKGPEYKKGGIPTTTLEIWGIPLCSWKKDRIPDYLRYTCENCGYISDHPCEDSK